MGFVKVRRNGNLAGVLFKYLGEWEFAAFSEEDDRYGKDFVAEGEFGSKVTVTVLGGVEDDYTFELEDGEDIEFGDEEIVKLHEM